MSFKRQLYLFHRWAGIVLCLFFALWFFSGLFMMYVEFPQLVPRERRAGAAVLDFSTATVTPGAAVATLTAGDFKTAGTPSKNIDLDIATPDAPATEIARIQLGMVANRPVYRIEAESKAQPRVVFADDGSVLRAVSPKLARDELTGFLRRSDQPAPLSYQGTVQTDQWTVSSAMNPHRPLHKFSVDNAPGTVMYVSSTTAEVVRDSSRQERVLNYFGAVTHWLYPTVIRRFPDAWAWMVDILSGAGTALAISGVWIGVLRWKRRPGRSVSPYSGFMKWHHFLGLAFGTLAVTWVFSGLLSMNPGDFNPPRAPTQHAMRALTGKAFTPADFDIPHPEHYHGQAVEAELLHYDSQPFLKLIARDGAIRVVGLDTDARSPSDDPEKLYAKLRNLKPGVPLRAVELLHRYDDYYYSRRPEQGGRVLPVIRVRFDDTARTWFHVDPLTGQVLERSTRANRVYRWLYNGLHSFDILWLWQRRPLWDIVVIAFSLGGLALSIIGLVIGVKRLRWELRRCSAPTTHGNCLGSRCCPLKARRAADRQVSAKHRVS